MIWLDPQKGSALPAIHKRFSTRAVAAMQLSPIPGRPRLSPLPGTGDSQIPEGADAGGSPIGNNRLTGAGDAADSTRRGAGIVDGVIGSEAAKGVSATASVLELAARHDDSAAEPARAPATELVSELSDADVPVCSLAVPAAGVT